MEFSQRSENDISIITINGNIALDGVNDAKAFLKNHIEDEAVKGIIINFEKVNFIDSSGIGLIVSVFKMMQERKAGFAISNLSKKNEEIFTITRLNQILSIFPTESEAVSAIQG